MTTPWPANAASPWICTGRTLSPSASPRRSWRARTDPSTTGVDDLEVRGVEGQRDVHVARRGLQIGRESLVVLDVARAAQLGQVVLALELAEQILRRLAEQIDQHVQPAAMRHADDRLLDAGAAAPLHQIVEQRDQAVAALEREALLAHVLGVQIALQSLGRGQLPEDVLLFLDAEPLGHARGLEIVLQPQPFVGVRHVRELRADGVGVDELEQRQDVLQASRASAAPRCGYRCRTRSRDPRPTDRNIPSRAHTAAARSCRPSGSRWRDQMPAVRIHLDETRYRALLGRRVIDVRHAAQRRPPPAWRALPAAARVSGHGPPPRHGCAASAVKYCRHAGIDRRRDPREIFRTGPR